MDRRLADCSTSELGVHTHNLPGGYGGGVIPDPIPNSVVKPSSVDGTAQVTVWESRTPPGSLSPQRPLQTRSVVLEGGVVLWAVTAQVAPRA